MICKLDRDSDCWRCGRGCYDLLCDMDANEPDPDYLYEQEKDELWED